MTATFYQLLDDALAEIGRRDPRYAALFPLSVSSDEMSSHDMQRGAGDDCSPEDIEQGLVKGLAYIRERWPAGTQARSADDPVAKVLCDSIVDAVRADSGILALRPHNGLRRPVVEILSQEYSARLSPRGPSYHVRHRGTRPLILLNATGTPIAIWNRFLSDTTHDFKIVVPRRRSSDLFGGGVQLPADIETEATDLAAILDAESIEQADAVAWCDGARVAVHLVNGMGERVSSLVLVGPMFKGIRGVAPSPSSFERDLQPLLDAVIEQPSLAPAFAKAIVERAATPNWARWKHAPASLARMLFALPSKEHALDMMAPLADPASLINMARRVASDERYPMDRALEALQARTMVIMGADDNIVSNALVVAAMKQLSRNSVVMVTMSGSGHYIQDLQYGYFRWLLTEFLDKRRVPSSTARISVDRWPREPMLAVRLD